MVRERAVLSFLSALAPFMGAIYSSSASTRRFLSNEVNQSAVGRQAQYNGGPSLYTYSADIYAPANNTCTIAATGTMNNRPLLRGAIVNRTYGTHKKLYISVFLQLIFGPIYYGPP